MTIINTLPSPDFFAFAIPLSLQALFIHPVFPSAISTPARFLLMFPSCYLALTAPFTARAFEPRRLSHGINFVLGVIALNAAWKGAEWGLAQNLGQYAWVGFEPLDEIEGDGGDDSGSGSDESHRPSSPRSGQKEVDDTNNKKDNNAKKERSKPSRAQLAAVRARAAANDSPLQILSSTFHLMASLRGIGYGFGPPPRALAPSFSRDNFLKTTLISLVGTHVTVTLCAAFLLATPQDRLNLVAKFAPSSLLYPTTLMLATIATGIAIFAGLALGFYALSLVFLGLTTLFKLEFDPRSYPPLLNVPWKAESVANLWSIHWHALFARPFRFLGYVPTAKVLTLLGAPRLAGKSLGAITVFALSAWLHEHGLWTATYDYESAVKDERTFSEHFGTSIYFILQSVGILCEGVFERATKKKVGGVFGRLWTFLVVAVSGVYIYRAWQLGGLFHNFPPPQNWSWQRFVLPFACVLPPPLWTKA